jgi:hypothetical protein
VGEVDARACERREKKEKMGEELNYSGESE